MSNTFLSPYGVSALVNRIIPEVEKDSFVQKALKCKTYIISNADLSVFYRIADGALSPLEGPMDSKEFNRVLEEEVIERKGNIFSWTIPIVFSIEKKDDLRKKLNFKKNIKRLQIGRERIGRNKK